MNNDHLIIFKTDDGAVSLDVRMDEDTVWLTLDQMAALFDRDKSTVSRHIKNVFEEDELEQAATVAKFATVQQEGSRQVERQIDYYNLDVIISVRYRVKSLRGTQFRQWATKRLNEYIRKGFTLDDERLKKGQSHPEQAAGEGITAVRGALAPRTVFYSPSSPLVSMYLSSASSSALCKISMASSTFLGRASSARLAPSHTI